MLFDFFSRLELLVYELIDNIGFTLYAINIYQYENWGYQVGQEQMGFMLEFTTLLVVVLLSWIIVYFTLKVCIWLFRLLVGRLF